MKEDTRHKIIQAARKLFIEKGVDGVNMREIADTAGVNKGLLHYYFKNKKNLFREVFHQEAHLLYQDVEIILANEIDLEQKISEIVDRYFKLLSENPRLPAFVLFESARDPEMLKDIPFRESIMRIAKKLEEDLLSHGWNPEPGQGIHFLLDIISLCAFFFAMQPVFSRVIPIQDGEGMKQYRREHIKTLLIKSIRS